MVSHLSPTRHALYIFTNHSSIMGAQCKVTFWKYELVYGKRMWDLKQWYTSYGHNRTQVWNPKFQEGETLML